MSDVTITISSKTAEFLKDLATRLKTQDNRGTADPYYFTIRKTVDVTVPEDCGTEEKYHDYDDVENYTKEQAIQRAAELNYGDFDDYVEDRCIKYETKEDYIYEEFFFTFEGYNEHIKLNGHNIGRTCKKFDSYVKHAFRNPEVAGILEAIKEIGDNL